MDSKNELRFRISVFTCNTATVKCAYTRQQQKTSEKISVKERKCIHSLFYSGMQHNSVSKSMVFFIQPENVVPHYALFFPAHPFSFFCVKMDSLAATPVVYPTTFANTTRRG